MYIVKRPHLAPIKQLLDYWEARCLGRPMPRRADVDPLDLVGLLPKLILVDFETSPFRIRYRLVGSEVVAAAGKDFTGKYVDEMGFDEPDKVVALYRRAFDTRGPSFRSGSWPIASGGTRSYESAAFPISEDGITVTQCLAIEAYQDSPNFS